MSVDMYFSTMLSTAIWVDGCGLVLSLALHTSLQTPNRSIDMLLGHAVLPKVHSARL